MACCAGPRSARDEGSRSCGAGLLPGGWSEFDGAGPAAGGGDEWLDGHSEEVSAETVSRHIAAAGNAPGVLLYSIAGAGSAGSSKGPGSGSAPSRRKAEQRQRACHIPPNTLEGVPIETDFFVGKVLFMHGPSPQDPHGRPGPFGRYFSRRKRNWEFRVQGRFKRIPRGNIFIGIVLRDFNYDQAVATHSMMVKRAAMALITYDVYISWGDRCEAAKKPDAELSHLVANMSAWDQIIVTPEGKVPPLLKGELQEFGDAHGRNLQRAKMGLKAYEEEVSDVLRNMSTKDTFTLCSWGVSQVVDPLRWQFKIGRYISIARFMEDQPIHVAMYELLPDEDGPQRKDGRHLESRKLYYLDFMFWSSVVECPSLPSRYIFQDATEWLERFAAAQCAGGPSDEEQSDAALGEPRRVFKRQDSYNPCGGGLRRFAQNLVARLRRIPKSTCAASPPASPTGPFVGRSRSY